MAPAVEPDYPEQDFACFQALAAGTSTALEEWLERYPEERLSEETADLLLDRRLEELLRKPRLLLAFTQCGLGAASPTVIDRQDHDGPDQ